jgi:hypothetical protein
LDDLSRRLPIINAFDGAEKVDVAALCRDDISQDEVQANAARIVACVNACKGIEDPEKVIPELVVALKDLVEQIEAHDRIYGECPISPDQARRILSTL